ncbi:MAG: HDOD domain-containing protein [Rhodocyclaceae bacterium]|nr:HDOD domain-containing protein [Rhodocyclaceae bacterium]
MSPQDESLVEAILASGITLPAPDIHLLELMRIAADEDSGLDDIAAAVSRTPATTGAVFRVAASPVFGQVRPRKTVLEAVVLLGKVKVLAIATSTALRAKLGDVPARVVGAIWDACFQVAQETWGLMHASRLPGKADDAFLAALMHDVGIALILRRNPDFLGDFALDAHSVDEAGLHVDGLIEVNHAAVGAHIARNWKLPDAVCDAIALHHSPPVPDLAKPSEGQLLSAAVAAGRRRAGAIRAEEWACWEPFVREHLQIPSDILNGD